LIAAAIMVIDTSRRLVRKPPIYYVDHLPFGFNAMTVPPIGIFITKANAENSLLLYHELIHWRQYLESGTVFFYVRYMLGWLSGYDGHPMEIEARQLENEHVQNNYTASVRSGLAKTIHDPDFRSA
jgi:hypothetical protein